MKRNSSCMSMILRSMTMTSTPLVHGSLDFRDRTATFDELEQGVFDVVVIGAGITGAGVARDAALRGLRVALVESRDIASGTSSRSSKMIHGGLRYLAQGDVGLVREAATERQVLRRVAPHLTRISPFTMPGSRRGIATMRAGLTAFERLGKVPRAERHRTLDATELLEREPTIRPDTYPTGVVYPEFLTNDARLTLANVRSAAHSGAVVATYAPVERILVDSHGRASGVEVRGALPGEDLGATVRARVVVNAAGPWVDAVRALENAGGRQRLTLTKGIHVVVPHERLPVRDTVITLGSDKRPLFAVHAGAVTYIGTTDTFYADADEWPRIDGEDVEYLLTAMAATFGDHAPEPSDIVSMWAGVRPLIAPEDGLDGDTAPSELSRRDEVWTGPAGVVSVAGGKLTAYRAMAERIVDGLVAELGTGSTRCRTADVPLVGGDVDVEALVADLGAQLGGRARRLVELWGTEAAVIAADAAQADTSNAGDDDPDGPLDAEVRHAVAHEGALRLTDVWVRRTARAWFTLDPVGEGIQIAATTMGGMLGWSIERTAAEIAEVEQIHHDSLSCLAMTPS